MRQLPLPFLHAPRFLTQDFVQAPSNEEARAWLERDADWPLGRLILYGEEGAGKSHLLHLWASRQGATILEGARLRGLPLPPGPGAVAVDDADDMPEERALLHLINQATESGRALLLTGRSAPILWPVRLPDLASRLRATATVALGPAEDALLRALLARLLTDRQLILSEGLQSWLLTRLPRHPGALREAVARLDRQALAEGRRVTRASAAAILREILAIDEDYDTSASIPSPEEAALL